jgi:parallel beta-helix repeat protein
MLFTKNDDGVRIWVTAVKNGALIGGLTASITVTVTDPDDSITTSPTVFAATQTGLYYADVPSSFFATNGLGWYVAVVEINGSGVKDVIKDSLRVFEEDFDSISAGSGAALSDVQDTVVTAVEYQRGHHTAETYLFVDPVNGSNVNDGLTRANPKLTIAAAVSAITQEHTAIIVLGNNTGQQVISENIVLDTPFTFLRGPGFDVQLAGTATNVATVQITATGCELSGFEVTTPVTGTGEAVDVNANFALLRRLRVVNAVQDGIDISGGSRSRIEECIIENSGRYGVHLQNTSFAFIGENTVITGSGTDNLRIQPGAGSADDTVIRDVTTTAAGQYGIFIGAGSNRTRLSNVAFVANTTADVKDDGTDTIFDTTEIIRMLLSNRLELADGTTDNWVLYDDNNQPFLNFSVTDKGGLAITQPDGAPSRRTKGARV